MNTYTGLEVAVIGVSGRFPEADNVQQFWNNLVDGRNSIVAFSDEELREAGESETAIRDPRYVKFGSYLRNKKRFDSSFFDYRPAEAALMDPQIRMFHECCWEALEDSGYSASVADQKIGLFASGSPRLPWKLYALLKSAQDEAVDDLSTQQLSGVTFLSSLISYKLNLGGPVMFLQSACSSSLAAIHQACNSILLGECKVALAGGVTVNNFSKKGYLYQEGSIQSADGKCRPFDHKASGTIFGEGAGVVVLKRLKDAIKDQDNVYAIVKGSAINNDGNQKIGYTAPSVSGQVEVLSQAIRNAKIAPESISYVEAHGTGTELGDPIEVEALCQAFRLSGSQNNQYCALGSVKSNIGHLDAASGVVGFIKVAMALKNRQLPATLHYEKPNPDINFENSPFFVNDQLKPWRSSSYPLRAGVSSLGIGGTNVHIILEEAPTREVSSDSRPYQLLTLSAKTATSLQGNAERLKAYLENHPETNLADIAYTLSACRPAFNQRATLVCKNREEAVELLTSFDQKNGLKAGTRGPSTVAFMFPGQGAQRHRMYAELYASEPVFKKEVDQGFLIAQTRFGKDLRSVLFSGTEDQIHRTEYTQPLLFVVEYALARLLMHWGIRPDVMIGHSIGEYVAACLSGVFSLKDALSLVIKRGELMEQMPGGTMVSVSIAEAELLPYLNNHPQVALAAVNSPSSCVVSGSETAIQEFKAAMDAAGLTSKELHTSHAFHSSMMDEMLRDFEQVVKQVSIHSPQIPLVSNLTGQMASEEDIITPTYWINHLRHTVRFSEGVRTIMAQPNVLFVEVGPGRALGSFVGASDLRQEGHVVVNLNDPSKDSHSVAGVLVGVGKLWQHGAGPDWERFYQHENRHVQSLPTYAFDPSTYEVDVDPERMIEEMITDKSLLRNEINKWFYQPTWKLSTITLEENTDTRLCTLVFEDQGGAGSSVVEQYQERGETVIRVSAGDKYLRMADDAYEVPPGDRNSYFQLFDQLATTDRLPQRIVHSWGATPEAEPGIETEKDRERYFFSLLHAFQTARTYKCGLKEITVLTSGLHHVMGPGEISSVAKSMTIGLLNVIGQEYPTITTGHIDISCAELTEESYREKLFNEVNSPVPGKIVSYRSGCRWTQMYDSVPVGHQGATPAFRKHGVYLITGGLGEFGYCMSKHLAYHHQARLVLLGREPLPPRTDWLNLLEDAATSERIKEKIRKISVIENQGGSVLYVADNLSCARRFSEMVARAEEHFGRLHGVFHAAGITEGRSVNSLDQLEKADFEAQFLPKVNGLLTLHEVLKDRALDFCLLTSSLAAILGGLGFGAYAPASIFMDYFVSTLTGHGRLKNWVSVNFDGINFDEERSDIINEQELPAVVAHLLSLRSTPQVAVSTKDLQTRLNHWVSKATTQESEEESSLAEVLADELEDQNPSNEERTLWQAWRNFFGRSDFGLDDNFFEIGGDSLKALTLNARISKEMSVDLSLSDFFAHPTIRGLASYIAQLEEEKSPSSHLIQDTIKPAPAMDYYILSPSQKRLYYLYELDKTSLAYNVHQAVRLAGRVDKNRVADALQKLVTRHEILRTSFGVIDGQPVQKVAQDVLLEIAESEATEEVVQDTIRDFVQPFDLSQAPLLRVALIKLAEEDHLLVVDMHHIVTDGVSQGVLIRDFMAYYNSEQLPEVRLHYKDFAEWTSLQQEYLGQQREFWKQEFAEDFKTLELPTDYPRPTHKSYRGDNRALLIGEEDTKKIRTLGEETGATLFMTILAIFNVLLSKLSNQADVTVGTGVAGREHADLESTLGTFVNTLAVRNYPTGGKTFRSFLSEVKTKVVTCLDHQSFPYESLIEVLRVPRDPGRNPLFDVALAFQNHNQEELIIPGLTLKPYDYDRRVSKYDIELTVSELNKELLLSFEYSTDLFKPDTIERFMGYFQNIVEQVISNQDRKLSQIEILSEAERRRIVDEFNNTGQPYLREKTIVDLFEEQAQRHPTTPAVVYGKQQLTYQALNKRSNQLARYLLSSGVIPGSVVGLLLERSVEMIVAIMGVLKAGAAYLPIDPGLPEQRVSYMLDQSSATLLLSHQAHLEQYSAYLPVKDITAKELYTGETNDVEVNIKATDVAYCIFTSGSTGLPKGVMMGHRGVVNLVKGLEKRVYNKPTKKPLRVALLASYAFDASIQQIAGALLQGHSLYIVDDLDRKDGHRLLDFYNRNEINVSDGTPTHLRLLIYALDTEHHLETLDHWLLAGEMLPKALVREFYQKNKEHKVQLYNFYGPTEACVDSTSYRVTPEKLDDYATVPIGKPLPNERVYITDAYGRLVPEGVIGEVCIAGDGLAQGYIGNADLTAERFAGNWVEGERRVYRTGDLGRWLPDGNLEYHGRIDYQVKLRSYRIELGEIERVLLEYPLVKNAVVSMKEFGEEELLVGYYVAGEALSTQALREHLSRRLPEYMLPTYFVHLAVMPLTTSGKVDRKALPNPEFTPNAYVAPVDKIEGALAAIWGEVLQRDPASISTTASFASLGGHSLKAIQLISKISQQLQVRVPLKELFEYQTIQRLSAFIGEQDISVEAKIEPAAPESYYPLSSAQRRMYFLYEYDPTSVAYNIPQVVKLEGALDHEKLSATFTQLIARHESLRTFFMLVEGEVVQVVHDEVAFALEHYEAETSSVQSIVQRFIRPFDLRQASQLRVGLIKLSEQTHLLLVDMHHIISDGVSHSQLIRDFTALYKEEKLPTLNLQYKDYAVWQQSSAQQLRLKAQRQFWLNEFAQEVSVLDLPTDHPRPVERNHWGASESMRLDPATTRQLKTVSEQVGATLYMTMLSVFNVLLSKLSGQEDITVGTPVAGRGHADVENIIGVFVNTVVLRNCPRGDKSFRQFLTEVKEKTLSCFEHQGYPYEELIEELGIPRDSSRNPLFDVMFSYQHRDEAELILPGLSLQSHAIDHKVSKFDLTLTVSEAEEDLYVDIEYATDLFDASTVARFMAYFQQIVTEVAANADQLLGEIDVLSEAEREQLLVAFNDTAVSYPQDKTIVGLFETQAREKPDDVAVVFEDRTMSYSQLNGKANVLAQQLLERGVKPTDIVPLIMSRGVEYVISFLAVRKVGACCAPISRYWPPARLEEVLGELDAPVVLANHDSYDSLRNVPMKSALRLLDCEEPLASSENPGCPVSLDNPMVMFYTSGTTGKPKGVLLAERGIYNRFMWMNDYFGEESAQSVLRTTKHIFDSSLWQLFWPLINGGKTIIPSEDKPLHLESFTQLLRDHQVTMTDFVPSLFRELVGELEGSASQELSSSLSNIVIGGEAISVNAVNSFRMLCPHVRLTNLYGPTEASIGCIYYPIERNNYQAIPIGRPISNMEAYVLDQAGHLCVPGVPGELHVAGSGLAIGYHNQLVLTQEKFVTNPVRKGEKAYKTGDLVRWLPDGQLEFLGRIDDQVKLRGYRIELGEVKKAFNGHEAIKDAIILVKEQQGNKYLVGYYVAEEALSTQALREHLSRRLPEYMLPTYFVHLAVMPLTTSGKVNRKALPNPEIRDTEGYVAPANEIEETLAAIWAEVLAIDKAAISVNKSFFVIGGNSIRAIKLIVKINKHFNVNIKLVDLFEMNQISQLADHIMVVTQVKTAISDHEELIELKL